MNLDDAIDEYLEGVMQDAHEHGGPCGEDDQAIEATQEWCRLVANKARRLGVEVTFS